LVESVLALFGTNISGIDTTFKILIGISILRVGNCKKLKSLFLFRELRGPGGALAPQFFRRRVLASTLLETRDKKSGKTSISFSYST